MMNTFIYLDKHSLLIVSEKAGMMRLNCPFQVQRLYFNGKEFAMGEYQVTEVRESSICKLEYKIDEIFYPYYLFMLPEQA
jgi:hypothetical protein